MKKRKSLFQRQGMLIVWMTVFLFPIVLAGARLTLRSNKNDIKQWLPDQASVIKDYREFQSHFKFETFILISWDGCTLGDQRLKLFTDKILADSTDPDNKIDNPMVAKVISGPSVIKQLTEPPLELSPETAIARLRGSLISKDAKTDDTCAVLILSATGKEYPRRAVELVERVATESGVPRRAIHMGGPPVDNVALDKAGERALQMLAGLSGLVGLGLSAWYMRNGRLTALIFLTSVYAAALSLALVYFTGNTMDSILLNMPSVVYTASLSGAIHIVNYYRFMAMRHGRKGAAGRGLSFAWLPCFLSAGTTALGLFSLYPSALAPISKFGLYAGLGVLGTLTLLFSAVPALLELYGPDPIGEDPDEAEEISYRNEAHRARMRWVAEWILGHQKTIWASFLIAMIALGWGITHVKTSINLMAFFSPKTDLVQSYTYLEKHLGPLVPMEVVLKIDKNSNLNFLERMELVTAIQRSIETLPDVGSTLSMATFSADIDTKATTGGMFGKLVSEKARRRTVNKLLTEHREDFLKGDYLAEDEANELWRINVRVAALHEIDYGEFCKDIKAKVDPVIKAEAANTDHVRKAEPLKGVSPDTVLYTGLTPLVYKAQTELLAGLVDSFFMAFVMIAVAMAINFRSVMAGLFTMIPTVWPVAIVFGFLGWMGIAVDVGTMMTAGVAMGVCVDDTIHYATWFRRGLRMGLDRRQATIFAFENAAAAMYQSSIIVAMGLAVFAVSDFMPTRRFGMLMMTLLSFGLFADLVLTPCMLAGPLGHFYSKFWRKKPSAAFMEEMAMELPPARSEPATAPAPTTTIQPPHVRIPKTVASRNDNLKAS